MFSNIDTFPHRIVTPPIATSSGCCNVGPMFYKWTNNDIIFDTAVLVHGPDMKTSPPPPWGFLKTVLFGHHVI